MPISRWEIRSGGKAMRQIAGVTRQPYPQNLMTCVEVTPEMARLLAALRPWPVEPVLLDALRAVPEWDQARAWGWVMASDELTGTGW